MKNKSDNTGNQDEKKKGKDSSKPYGKWKDEDKNRMGNDVSSEIKIANAGGHMEGGDNKQWHMDQGNFEDHEKEDFENSGSGK